MKYRILAKNTKKNEKVFNTGKEQCDFYIEGLVAPTEEGSNQKIHLNYTIVKGQQQLQIDSNEVILRIGGKIYHIVGGQLEIEKPRQTINRFR